MGLYLFICDGEKELLGIDVGFYSDFGWFRGLIAENLEGGEFGSRFPTLMLHSDCDGQWSPEEAKLLEKELQCIKVELETFSPIDLNSGWQISVAETMGLEIESLYDCFFDVNGEPLVDGLIRLAKTSYTNQLPILFQ